MECRRTLKKNKILNDIRDSENFISRSESTIKRIKNTQMGVNYINSEINRLKTAISTKSEVLEKLLEYLRLVDIGGLDEEIMKEYNFNKERQNKLNKEKQYEKEKIDAEKKEKKSICKNYWNGVITESRDNRKKQRTMAYEYRYFLKVCDSLPEYIQRNLSEMPNNKGYIWRGVYFYGSLPPKSGPRVMFEKKRGGVLVIHEYTDLVYKRYEKKGKDKKKLVYTEPKKLINTVFTISDYIKK